ncbi:hypothetical protein AVEN_33846-1 [Araneus ventricosus]|uniref:Uncharacterized protein n=1 Tax=Araneus ventricosus TaxID=182803 RepID=A0A4Y2J5P2_ARAVE|nr:hypothetical protein AVEN_33846-1 [Araneus ventricosus]
MSIFAGSRKCDLKILAEELGEIVYDSHKLKNLKKMILASKEYDEECAQECLNTTISERKEHERINEEIQERRREEEINERRRKEEYDEQKQKDEMEFELQKIHFGAEDRISNSVSNQNVDST